MYTKVLSFFYLSGDLAFVCQIWGRVRACVMFDNGNWVITIHIYVATLYLDRVALCKHCCALQCGILSGTTTSRLKVFLRPDQRYSMVNENLRTPMRQVSRRTWFDHLVVRVGVWDGLQAFPLNQTLKLVVTASSLACVEDPHFLYYVL
jgi:hypothetical protein